MSDHKCTYSKSTVCVSRSWIEWRLCAAFPSRGVLVVRVSKHPLDMAPSKGEQGPQCLPAPSALSWTRLPPWLPAPNPTWHAWRWGKHLSHEHCPRRDGPFQDSTSQTKILYSGRTWFIWRKTVKFSFIIIMKNPTSALRKSSLLRQNDGNMSAAELPWYATLCSKIVQLYPFQWAQ